MSMHSTATVFTLQLSSLLTELQPKRKARKPKLLRKQLWGPKKLKYTHVLLLLQLAAAIAGWGVPGGSKRKVAA